MTRLCRERLLHSVGWVLLVLLGLAFGPAPPAAAETVPVKRIHDGDTVQLAEGRLLRSIGINEPEIDHARHTAQPWGFEARTQNAELVAGQSVRLEFDLERLDDYGRTLAYVFLSDGTMVNEKLLRSGVAFCLFMLPNIKYESRLLAAQRAAMRERRGLWQNWREGEGRYVGNRNSRRFHLASCPEAKRMAARNRVMFSSRWDAFWAGYSPSRECQADFFIPSD